MANTVRIFDNRRRRILSRHSPSCKRCSFAHTCKKSRQASADILGIDKIFNPGHKLWMKIVWFLISSSCIGLCLYQIGLRVTEFVNSPLRLDINIERQKSFIFPSVTVCSGSLTYFMKELVNVLPCRTLSSCSEKYKSVKAFLNESISVPVTWDENEMRIEMLRVGRPCPMFASDNEACHQLMNASDVMNAETIDTIWGRCLILTLKNKTMDFRGPYTWISIHWKDEQGLSLYVDKQTVLLAYSYCNCSVIFQYFIHEEGIRHVHDAPYIIDSFGVGFELKLRITAKEYYALNTWNKPCVSEEESLKCFDSCIDKLMEKELPCGLPFINSTQLRVCDKVGELMEAFRITDQLYASLEGGSCVCPRICHKIKYITSMDALEEIDAQHASDDNVARLVLLYGDETKEIITEKYAFAQSALFSEIGGSLGLYLGINIFTIVDVLEHLIRRAIVRFKRF